MKIDNISKIKFLKLSGLTEFALTLDYYLAAGAEKRHIDLDKVNIVFTPDNSEIWKSNYRRCWRTWITSVCNSFNKCNI